MHGEDMDLRPFYGADLSDERGNLTLLRWFVDVLHAPSTVDQYGCQRHGLKLLLDAHYEVKLDRIGGVSMVCVDVCV